MRARSAWKIWTMIAVAAAAAGAAMSSPGAWGLAISWTLLALGSFLWAKAGEIGARVQVASDIKAQAYAKGEAHTDAHASAWSVKVGAACAVGSLACLLIAAICMVGCAALGARWALGAAAPLVAMAAAHLASARQGGLHGAD